MRRIAHRWGGSVRTAQKSGIGKELRNAENEDTRDIGNVVVEAKELNSDLDRF